MHPRFLPRALLLSAATLSASALSAQTLDIYILTGQSNSLGTIQNSVRTNDVAVGSHPAEIAGTSVPFWFDNFNGYKNTNDINLGASTAWGTVSAQPQGSYAYPFLGPELGFARAMQEAGVTNFGIVKASRDGGGNTNWVSTATPPADGTASGAGTAYWKVVDTITSATSAANLAAAGYTDFRIRGLMYLQGESNNATEAAAAVARIQQLVTDLKAQFGADKFASDFKTVLGENLNTASYNIYGTAGWGGTSGLSSSAGVTNTNLKSLADGSADYNWVKTSDLSICNTDNAEIHADANSQITIGQRFAYAFANADATVNTLGSGGSWASAANWSAGATPGASHIVVLGASSALNQTLDGSYSIHGLAYSANTSGSVVINSGAGVGNTLTLGIGGIDTIGMAGANSLTINADVSVGAQDQTWNIANTTAAADVTLNGALSGSATITKNGAGMLVLGGSNTFTGKFAVSGGGIQFTKQSALYGNNTAAWTASNLAFGAGVTAAFNVGGTGEFTAADIDLLKALGTATGGFMSGSRLGLDTTNASGGNFTYASVISNTNGGANVLGLTKMGTGTLTLSVANTYTGGTVIEGGKLVVAHGQAIGGSSGANASAVVIKAGELNIGTNTTGTYGSSATNFSIRLAGLTMGGVNGATSTLSGTTVGFGVGPGFGSSITYDATNNGGTATISALWSAVGSTGANSATVTVGDSSATNLELDFTGRISNTASIGAAQNDGRSTTLVKSGAGTMRISAANGLPGLTVSAGRLIANHANALGSDRTSNGGLANTIAVNAGGTLQIGGATGPGTIVHTVNAAGAMTVAGGTLDLSTDSAAVLTIAAAKNLVMTSGTILVHAQGNTGVTTIGQIQGGSGAFQLTGGILDLGGNFNASGQYQLISGFTGANSVSGLTLSGYDSTNFTASLSTAGLLTVTAVPEPSAYGLLAAGALGLAAVRRRRKGVR